ncbi:5'-3' exonuclease PLD3 isoform X2 [Polypterus senegalus]|nr:5'-3' exonuclease PLD3 isoform X2 [Polypterus senegalus]
MEPSQQSESRTDDWIGPHLRKSIKAYRNPTSAPEPTSEPEPNSKPTKEKEIPDEDPKEIAPAKVHSTKIPTYHGSTVKIPLPMQITAAEPRVMLGFRVPMKLDRREITPETTRSDSPISDQGATLKGTDDVQEKLVSPPAETVKHIPIQSVLEEKVKAEITKPDTEILQPRTKQDRLPRGKFAKPNTIMTLKNLKPVTTGHTKKRYLSFLWLFLLPILAVILWYYEIPRSGKALLQEMSFVSDPSIFVGMFMGPEELCESDCSFQLVESIPTGLEYPEGSPLYPSIFQAWKHLLNEANGSVDIAAFYFTLRDTELENLDPSADQGRQIFEALSQLQPRGIKLSIAVNSPQSSDQDTTTLSDTGAEVRNVDLKVLTGGIIHTKLWVVDKKHVYVGSANMDWRSLTQVKELGATVYNCSCLAQDMEKIFQMYFYLGKKDHFIPALWPTEYTADSSKEYPLSLKLNGVPSKVYLSSAPPSLCGDGRTDDLTAIIDVIQDAQKFIYISVMDYLPMSEYSTPKRFWPTIDTQLRVAACEKRVQVRLLVSCWEHSYPPMFVFLESLDVLKQKPLECKIEVKIFHVGPNPGQRKIPFTRVNHAKYMVTDRVAYIGTSNWSESYFTQTAGVGIVINQTDASVTEDQTTVQNQLEAVFLRDWNSNHAVFLEKEHSKKCHVHHN